MSAEGRKKYGAFIQEVLKDFDSRVQAIQTSGEENTKAYEHYCSELKRQLEESHALTEELRGRLEGAEGELRMAHKQFQEERRRVKSVATLYSSLTSLSVEQTAATSQNVLYNCRITDGLLTGHVFTLSIDKSCWEYTYTPVTPSTSLEPGNKFSSSLCFPDYMLGRFLTNLLAATYPPSSSSPSSSQN